MQLRSARVRLQDHLVDKIEGKCEGDGVSAWACSRKGQGLLSTCARMPHIDSLHGAQGAPRVSVHANMLCGAVACVRCST